MSASIEVGIRALHLLVADPFGEPEWVERVDRRLSSVEDAQKHAEWMNGLPHVRDARVVTREVGPWIEATS